MIITIICHKCLLYDIQLDQNMKQKKYILLCIKCIHSVIFSQMAIPKKFQCMWTG